MRPEIICDLIAKWAEVAGVTSPNAGRGRLAVCKSDLLARLLYGGEKGPSYTPCPVHKGQWSGMHWGWPGDSIPANSQQQEWWDAGCRCATHKGSANTTGWQPDTSCGCVEEDKWTP